MESIPTKKKLMMFHFLCSKFIERILFLEFNILDVLGVIALLALMRTLLYQAAICNDKLPLHVSPCCF